MKAAAIVLLSSGLPARAHDAITLFGTPVTGFPALMLHPLLTPDQALLLAGIVLVAGATARNALPSVALALVAGMLAGKAGHLIAAFLSAFWYAPLFAAFAAGLAVAGFGRIGARAGAIAIFVLGFVLAAGIIPEEPTLRGLGLAVGAAIATGLVCLALIGLPLTVVAGYLRGIPIRIAGAWLAAIALINLALAIRILSAQG
ncbi:MAG: hypothetical protein KDE55_24175 [Novosphingobium sp.]|nr:hypothetical protein [Novosphingobium sp.]